ncbi:MAG: hypothetical protein ACFFD2_01490 [Promethearchaeota archaeon]
MYYDSEEVCSSESLHSAGGEPSGRVDRSYGAGGTTNRLPLGRSSSTLENLKIYYFNVIWLLRDLFL